MPTCQIKINGKDYTCEIRKRKEDSGDYSYVCKLFRRYVFLKFEYNRTVYSARHVQLSEATDDLQRVIENTADTVEDNTRIKNTLETTVQNTANGSDNVEVVETE